MADATFDEKLLQREWVHVSEEDTADHMVLRPADAPRGPSRGRLRLRLDADGRARVTSVGRGDAPETVAGSWRLAGGQLAIALDTGERWLLQIAALETDRLVVKQS